MWRRIVDEAVRRAAPVPPEPESKSAYRDNSGCNDEAVLTRVW